MFILFQYHTQLYHTSFVIVSYKHQSFNLCLYIFIMELILVYAQNTWCNSYVCLFISSVFQSLSVYLYHGLSSSYLEGCNFITAAVSTPANCIHIRPSIELVNVYLISVSYPTLSHILVYKSCLNQSIR